ncbi:MAG TPA: GNAT family N-acetyltransferase [Candidatus Limnocylindrales bacterium]
MSVEIRVCPPERFAEFLRMDEITFSEDTSDELIKRIEAVSDKERFVCAMEDDQFVATGGVFGVHLTVPWGDMPAGGVTWVSVLPTHRRRGLMSQMMRRMIDDCHRRGEPIAMLWASEGAIYQRFGFGVGTFSVNLEAEPKAFRFARDWPIEGRFRLLPAGEGREVVEPVYEAARAQRSGFLSRTPDWWLGILPDAEKDKKGGEAKRLVVYETDAGAEAYAVYKTKPEWGVSGRSHQLIVDEAIGSTPSGTREIWRYLLSVDLVRTVKTRRLPSDHPLLVLAAEPRRLGATMGDGLWIRILDVAAALQGRKYGIDGHGRGRVTFDLRDEFCSWNAGRWSLEVEDGRALVTRTDTEADLALDANDLASLFLGGFTATALSAAGRVVEMRPGGLSTADSLFPTALKPWCPQEF